MRSDGRDGAGRRADLLAGALALALPFATFCALAWAAAPATAAGRQTSQPLAVPVRPSIPAGERVYAADCVRCHAQRSRFADRAWRASLTPADVTRRVLGEAAGHPAALHDLAIAWDATAYVWTLPDDGARIRRGESLAFQAEKALRSDALSVVLLHWNQLQDVKDASWVLNHTPSDVDALMRQLAGSRYTALPAADRRDLVDYVFASFFTWPASW